MPAALKIKRYIENDIWKITFSLDALTLPESDKELIRKFGEPQINIGGLYSVQDTEQNTYTYTLADKFIRIRSDLPYTQEFDSKSPDYSEQTELKAYGFTENFKSLYYSAFSDLRDQADTFTGEEIFNIV